jgi:alpha-L-fucosidase
VIHTLADVVSKNGNLQLSIPVKSDGTLDSNEIGIVEGIAHWMEINSEGIFATRPWKVFGESPASQSAPLRAQGFNEGRGKPVTAEDFRFTMRKNVIYVIQLGVPTQESHVKSLGRTAGLLDRPIESVDLVGSGERLKWSLHDDALSVAVPRSVPSPEALLYKVTCKS